MGEISNHILTRREKVFGWILGILFLVIYLAFPNIDKPNGDAVGWGRYLDSYAAAGGSVFLVAERQESGSRLLNISGDKIQNLGGLQRDPGWWILWNPHHLLYLPVTAPIFRVAHRAFPSLDGIEFLRVWNAFASAAMLMLLYFLLARLIPGSPYVLPWCIFLAASPTFFRYATDGTQYMTVLMLLAAGSGSILAFARLSRSAYLIRSGIWFALAILFHQIAVLIVPFLLIATWLHVRGKNREKDKSSGENYTRSFIGMASIAIFAPLIVYLTVAAVALGPTGEFNFHGLLKYATLYAQQERYWTSSVADGFLTNLLTMVGFYFGNDTMFAHFFKRIWFTVFIMVLPTLWLTTAIRARALPSLSRWWLGLCLLWLIPLEIFLSFWNPGHEFYQLFAVIPISVISLVGAESVRSKGRRGMVDIGLFLVWCVAAMVINIPQYAG